MFLISFTLTGLGFAIAWKMDSTAAFHGVMMLLLVPMWMVSGALFPMATAHGAVKAIMWANPMTYSVALLNHTLGLPNAYPGAVESLVVTAAFGIALLLAQRHAGGAEIHAQRRMSGRVTARQPLPDGRWSPALALLAGCAQVKPLPVLGQVPQFQLTAQTDQPFDSHTLDGHIWVADFIYTTCDGPCPMMSHQMRGIQNSTGATPDLKLVSLHRGSGARHAARARQIRHPLQGRPGALVFPDR